MCVVANGKHHQERHHQTWDDPGEKELAHRHVGHHSVDHERKRRRDDGPERRGRGGDADRETKVVAMVAHGLDLDGAQARGIGDRGSRHAGENHRADDVDVAEPAFEPAHQRQRKVVNAVGDAGVIHEIAGHDEKRHREQREAVDAADHAVDHHERRQIAGQQDIDQRRARHRDGNRHAGGHHAQEGAEQCGDQSVSVIAISGRSSTL